MRRKPAPARLDADRTAKPRTALAARVSPDARHNGNATHYVGDDGSKVALCADVSLARYQAAARALAALQRRADIDVRPPPENANDDAFRAYAARYAEVWHAIGGPEAERRLDRAIAARRSSPIFVPGRVNADGTETPGTWTTR